MAIPRFRKSDRIYVRTFLITVVPLLSVFVFAALFLTFRGQLFLDLDSVVGILILFIMGFSGTLILAAYYLRGMLRPLHVLARSMRRLQANEPVYVQEISTGEMGELERGFNSMARELSSMNEQLQSDVDKATSELRETLESFEIRIADFDIARKRAVEANRVKSDFLANISHEMRTPMNGIIGFSDILQKTELNRQQKEYVKSINRSGHILLKIIGDILDYANLESGKLILQHRPFRLRDAIESAVQLHAPQAHANNIELVSLVYSDVPNAVIGDETRVIQILANLLSNAVKFTSIGEVVLRVMLEHETDNHIQIGFTVTDTGIGIPLNEQSRLFDAFKQGGLSTKRVFGGTGLGLSLCQILAQAMGGSISVSSKNGEGSTFRVSISLELESAQTWFDQSIASGEKAILLEPQNLSRIVLRNMLTDFGLIVDEHESMQLSNSIATNAYSFAVLASSSSEIDLANTERALDELQRSNIDCIVLVSSSDQHILERFRLAGAFKCLSKPTSTALLSNTIRALLSKNASTGVLASESSKKDDQLLEGKLCLAVDDNPINLQLLCHIIESMGGQYVCADNGQHAIQECQNNQFDIIFMDIHMPVVNGLKAADEIKKNYSLHHVPIIALTADASEENQRGIQRSSIDRYLIKPIIEEDLQNEVRALLYGTHGILNETDIVQENMDPVLNASLPTRDKKQALRIAGGSQSIADKLYAALCDELPEMLSDIQKMFIKKDLLEMWQLVHRLHGASAVCGVPAFHNVLGQLQGAIKLEDNDRITRLHFAMQDEANKLIAEN